MLGNKTNIKSLNCLVAKLHLFVIFVENVIQKTRERQREYVCVSNILFYYMGIAYQ